MAPNCSYFKRKSNIILSLLLSISKIQVSRLPSRGLVGADVVQGRPRVLVPPRNDVVYEDSAPPAVARPEGHANGLILWNGNENSGLHSVGYTVHFLVHVQISIAKLDFRYHRIVTGQPITGAPSQGDQTAIR